jgi:PAS domain S-box-containing protein
VRRSAAILIPAATLGFVACALLPPTPRIVLYDLVTVGALAAYTAGVRRNRPERLDAWYLLLAAGYLWGAGQLVASLSELAGGPPSAAGVPAACYLAGYASLGAGVVRLGWGVERAQALRLRLDAAVVTLALVLALWAPAFDRIVDRRPHVSILAVAYPALDLLLLGWSVRIVLAGGRGLAAILLPTTFALVLTGDLLHGAANASLDPAGDAFFLLSLFAAAGMALAPSMRDLEPPPCRPVRAPVGRWALYGAALVLLPLTFLAEWAWAGRIQDRLLYVVAGLAVTALVVARLALLFGDLEEAFDAAQRSERKFRLIFEASPIGISVGREGIMSETNPALQRMLGYTGEELRSKHFTDVTHPDDREDPPQVFGDTERRALGFAKRYLTRDGESVDTRVHVVVGLQDGLGIALIEDVREQLALEERLRQAQKLEAVGQLAGGVAHDFNNLMTAVNGYSELLLRELDDPAARRKVAAIGEAAARASELTRQLLAFGQRQVLDVRELDLCHVVADAERLLAPLLDGGVRLDTALAGEPVPVVADPSQLQHVLVNLAANAQAAMADGGTLRLAVHADGGDAVLTVEDDGPGLAPEVRDQIFEPFFSTNGFGESKGLGLATVHGIVHQSGGSIDVESELGEGTCFTIRLPLAPVAGVA